MFPARLRASQVSPRELNTILSEIEDAGLLAFRDAMLDEKKLFLRQLVSVMVWTTAQDKGLVEVIDGFFRTYGREEDLLLWAIRHEIEVTDRSPELFRMQSFAAQMLFRMFFNERGMKYLQKTVLRVIETLVDVNDEKLELLPNGVTVSVAEATDNLQFLLEIAEDLFKLLDDELKYCPSEIRRGFACMREVAMRKFPEVEDSVVPVCFFLRFLCPTLLQPEQFNLVREKRSDNVTKALLIISKLLQNIANGIIKNNITSFAPHDSMILNFINKNIYTVHEFCVNLADRELIKEDEVHVTKAQQGTSSECEAALDALYTFVMMGDFRAYLDQQESMQEQREKALNDQLRVLETFCTTLEKNVLSTNSHWRTYKATDALTMYINRTAMFWYRVEAPIRATLAQVQTALESMEFSDWTNRVFGDKLLVPGKCVVLDRLENLQEEWMLRFKFPFPFGYKSVVVKRAFYAPDNRTYQMLLLPVAGKSKTTLDVAMIFRAHNSSSKMSNMTFFYALNPDGSFPSSLNSVHSKSFLSAAMNLIDFVSSDPTSLSKRVEMDDVSLQRKESSMRLMNIATATAKGREVRDGLVNESDGSLGVTHSSENNAEQLKSKSNDGSSDSSVTPRIGPRSNSLVRIKQRKSQRALNANKEKVENPNPLSASAPSVAQVRQEIPSLRLGRTSNVILELPDLILDEEGLAFNARLVITSSDVDEEVDLV